MERDRAHAHEHVYACTVSVALLRVWRNVFVRAHACARNAGVCAHALERAHFARACECETRGYRARTRANLKRTNALILLLED